MTGHDFNRLCPRGGRVRIKPKTKGNPMSFPLETVTTNSAYHLGSGKAVVRVQGSKDPVPVDDLEIVPAVVDACGEV